jgi:hypothetical protein
MPRRKIKKQAKFNDRVYDFLVVGGGIAGLSSAYHLLRDGYSVAVIERYNSHKNASTDSTAMTSHDLDSDWPTLISRFGLNGARDLWGLSDLALKLLSKYIKEVNPRFLLRRMPAHVFSNSKADDKDLYEAYKVYKSLGANPTFIKDGSALYKEFSSVIKFEGEGETNNLAILATLLKTVRKRGEIFMNSPVVRIDFPKGGVAAGNKTLLPKVPAKTKTERTVVLGFTNHKMPKIFRSSILWDIKVPYHYLRSFRGNTLWVGGADIEDKEYNPKKDYFTAFEKDARKCLNLDKSYKVTAKWVGAFYPSATGLPYIGKVPGMPVYLNLGFGGTGILYTFISGYLISSWLKGKETKYQRYFRVGK